MRTAVFMVLVSLSVVSRTPFADPLESPHSTLGAPLLLYLNPAFLYLQPALPIGIQAAYGVESGAIEIRSGFATATGKNGVALGVESVPSESEYDLSIAGAQQLGPLAIGSDIDLLAAQKFNAAIGLSLGHAIMGRHLISLNLTDLTITDTTIQRREPLVSAVGSIILSEKYSLSTDVRAGVRFVQPGKREYGYLIAADIQEDFFRNHILTAYYGGYGEIHPNLPNIAVLRGGVGFRFPVGSAEFAMYAGYAYDYYKTKTAVTVSLVSNPTIDRDRATPSASIALEDSVLLLSATQQQQRLVLSLSCKEGQSSNGVVRWILVISRDYDGHEIVRSFSGGGPAPSTIIWDGRTSNGTLCEPGVYFARLSAIDVRKNLGQSEPVRLVVRN